MSSFLGVGETIRRKNPEENGGVFQGATLSFLGTTCLPHLVWCFDYNPRQGRGASAAPRKTALEDSPPPVTTSLMPQPAKASDGTYNIQATPSISGQDRALQSCRANGLTETSEILLQSSAEPHPS